MDTLLYTALIDDRHTVGTIASRIGLKSKAAVFDENFDFLADVRQQLKNNANIHCLFVDEAQFLTKTHVKQLSAITIDLELPALCYGLRSDFLGECFEGSKYLLAWADVLTEIKTICHCGAKATMVMRLDQQGNVVREGNQVEIGGNDKYVSVCRKHFILGQTHS